MEYTQLGRTGLKVSRFCLGTMNFGNDTPEDDSHAIMDDAHESGINFFDTADVYGGKAGLGGTESVIGRWFAKGDGRRDRTVLATKLYNPMSDWPNGGRLSALHIRRAIDDSLRRLQTDRIDLLQFHHVDRLTPWDEIWQAVEVAVGQGKVLYTGSSNFAGWHIATAQEAARRRGYLGLASEQSLYNLLIRDIELEVIPAAEHNGIGILVWSPLQGGLLAGVLRKDREGRRRTYGRASDSLEIHRAQIERFEDLADRIGSEPAHIALAWLLTRPGVTAPIIGPRTPEQLSTAVVALDLVLDDQVLEELDSIFPGHKTAPEDYAW